MATNGKMPLDDSAASSPVTGLYGGGSLKCGVGCRRFRIVTLLVSFYAVAVAVAVPEPVDVLVLVGVALDVLVLVLVGVDVAVPVELAVAVLVAVALALADADVDEVFMPDVERVADELLVDVAVELAVLVEVGVDVLVPVDEAVAEAVDVEVDEAEADAVDVEVGELDVSSATSCVPISVSTVMRYRLNITFRTAFTETIFVIVHLEGRSAVAVALYDLYNFSMIANTILRISPVDASASAALNSGNVAMGTVMVVASADQLANQVVGVLSNATDTLLYFMNPTRV